MTNEQAIPAKQSTIVVEPKVGELISGKTNDPVKQVVELLGNIVELNVEGIEPLNTVARRTVADWQDQTRVDPGSNNLTQIASVKSQEELVKVVKHEVLSTNRNESDISKVSLISVQKQGSAAENNFTKEQSAGNNKEKGHLLAQRSKEEAVKGDDILLTDSKATVTDFTSILAKEKTQSVAMAEGKNVAVPSVWEQVTNEMQRRFVEQGQEVKELEISLHPADLGKIKIALRWENGQVHLQCQASEATTAGILQQNLAQLRESLQSIGISCGMLQMGFGGQQQHQHKNELNFTKQPGEPEKEEEEGQGRRIFNTTNGNSGDHIINVKV